MLELLAIAEPASDIERRGVVTADRAILRQGRRTLRRLLVARTRHVAVGRTDQPPRKPAENPEESAKL